MSRLLCWLGLHWWYTHMGWRNDWEDGQYPGEWGVNELACANCGRRKNP